MSKKKRAPKVFEPWAAAKSQTWDLGFRFPPVASDHVDADRIAKWHADRAKAEADAEWIIRGSLVWEPGITRSLDGTIAASHGDGILAVIRQPKSIHPSPPDAEAVAKRIVACVNACAGIADPERAVRDARELLLELALGRTDAGDERLLGVMSRLHPDEPNNALSGTGVHE